MPHIYFITLNTLLVQGAHIGSRVVASLLALKLGASPFTIGLLISIYSVFPLLLGVYAGRITDRLGARRPMLAGNVLLLIGLLVPAISASLPMLFVSAVLVGTGFVFFNVSNQTLGGALGTVEERTRNFATIGLGYAAGHLVGPVIAGYSIDYLGYVPGYLMLALLLIVPIITAITDRRLDAGASRGSSGPRNTFDLLKVPLLRRAIIVSGLITTSWDLFGFYVPIYGHSIGLGASTIGNILGAFAVATFIVRALLPRLTRRYSIVQVLSAAAFSATVFFVPFPMTESVPLLFMLAFGIGLSLGCSQPLTLNLAYNLAPPGRSGEVTGLRLTINNITHIIVPVGAGALAAAIGAAPVFWASASLLAVSGWLTRRIR